ncbi:outer membrane protein assembly factor BamE [Lacisediminimonas profundi]|uniref:outer membrane protein assembly factor BamE n=1 Tax=Lacisediminimonas profundi TaxID=2603856 RepID=UPI00124B63FA|nr:outer membrane protein assembly factor BamE [Lacisediminimonas profundi]
MKQLVRAFFAFFCSIMALGCDQQGRLVEEAGLEKLARGVSSEGDVRTAMGRPDTVWEEESGERVLEYPKGPNGVRTWMFDIGKDGKLKDWRQVLTEDNFKRITPGMSMDQVRRMLGRPRSTMQFRLKNEEVWDWLYQEGPGSRRLFNVHFDIGTRVVTRVSTSEDPDVKP